MARRPVTREVAVRQRDVPAGLYESLPTDLDPVLRRVYAARQVQPSELKASLADMLPVGTLGGVSAASQLLADARHRQSAIVVVGDFDADGATATALTVTAMRGMGYSRVSYLVPNRFEFGYGLSPAVVELVAPSKPDILITVDNGINSIEGVTRAKALGIKVLITDHHLPGARTA